MCSLFDDRTFIHHKDEIGVLDGGEAMCYDERCPVLRETVHSLLYRSLRPRIHGTRSLIQYEERRFIYHRTSDGELLSLTGRECRRTAEDGIVTVGKRGDEVVYPYCFTRFDDILITYVLSAVDDVLHYRPFEEPGILKYHAELSVYIFSGDLFDGAGERGLCG